MKRTAFCSIVAENYLAYARVLAESLRRFHPNVPVIVLVLGKRVSRDEPFRVVTLDDLEIPSRDAFLFRYNFKQVAVALKPTLILRTLQTNDTAIFVDPDMMALDTLTPLIAEAEAHAMTVTPHIASVDESPTGVEKERQILLTGMYNAGVVGCTACPDAMRFLRWWEMRLRTHCEDNLPEGLHYDQRWLDLAPALVKDFHIFRDVGTDTAYWTLSSASVHSVDGSLTVNGSPCRLFHFSGFDPRKPDQLTSYFPELRVDAHPSAAPLFRRYAALLEDAGFSACIDRPWPWDRFSNGVPIPGIVRRVYQDAKANGARFGDPFDTRGKTSFFAWLNSPADPGDTSTRYVSKLWHWIYQQSPDVGAVMPDPLGQHRDEYLEWIENWGIARHNVPAQLVPHFLPQPGPKERRRKAVDAFMRSVTDLWSNKE